MFAIIEIVYYYCIAEITLMKRNYNISRTSERLGLLSVPTAAFLIAGYFI